MLKTNPYTGVAYDRHSYPTDADKFEQYSPAHVAHFQALWARKPLKHKFWIAARRWSWPIFPTINITFIKEATRG